MFENLFFFIFVDKSDKAVDFTKLHKRFKHISYQKAYPTPLLSKSQQSQIP